MDEVLIDEGLKTKSTYPFKGNSDIAKLRAVIEKNGPEKIPFVRLEAGTNLVGGQPFSLENMKEVRKVCDEYGLMLVLDASLLQDNLYFIKTREESCKHKTIREITREIADLCDIIYFSARKLGAARGGGIITNSEKAYRTMRDLVPLFEGFLTYGGMSVREMEAMAVGLEETMDEEVINQGPQFIEYMVNELDRKGIPVDHAGRRSGLPSGCPGVHPPCAPGQYPAGALGAAMYIAGAVRGMERGTLSEQRNPDGSERLSEIELLRLALPRRVFTLSQVKYAIDRITWLYENRALIGGLKFIEEPPVLRFFFGQAGRRFRTGRQSSRPSSAPIWVTACNR